MSFLGNSSESTDCTNFQNGQLHSLELNTYLQIWAGIDHVTGKTNRFSCGSAGTTLNIELQEIYKNFPTVCLFVFC